MAKKAISIIIPAYKQEQYLRQCLDSVVSQTLEDIEIIIVDEGDFDETRAIINEYEAKDNRIKTIHEKNGGYGASVNKGIKLATGEYIGIVEADDFIEKNMYKDLYAIAQKFDAEIVKSDFYYYTTSNNQKRKAGKISKNLENKVINIDIAPSILKIQPSIWSAIYKREFLLNKNIFFLETAGGSYQDTSFAFKALSSARKVILSSYAYLNYRIDNENASVKSTGKIYAICREYEELTAFLDRNPDIKSKVNSLKLINQYNAYIWNLKRISDFCRSEFITKFSSEFKVFYDNGELDKTFYKKIKKEHIELLLKDKKRFEEYIAKLIAQKEQKEKRNKKFSIRINSSRIDIVFWGRQIFTHEFH